MRISRERTFLDDAKALYQTGTSSIASRNSKEARPV